MMRIGSSNLYGNPINVRDLNSIHHNYNIHTLTLLQMQKLFGLVARASLAALINFPRLVKRTIKWIWSTTVCCECVIARFLHNKTSFYMPDQKAKD